MPVLKERREHKPTPPALDHILAERTEHGGLEIISGHARYNTAVGFGFTAYIRRELGEGLVELGMTAE